MRSGISEAAWIIRIQEVHAVLHQTEANTTHFREAPGCLDG